MGVKYFSAESCLLFRVCSWESVCQTEVALGVAEKIAIVISLLAALIQPEGNVFGVVPELANAHF